MPKGYIVNNIDRQKCVGSESVPIGFARIGPVSWGQLSDNPARNLGGMGSGRAGLEMRTPSPWRTARTIRASDSGTGCMSGMIHWRRVSMLAFGFDWGFPAQ
jgi:hypothetical protein